MKIKLTKGVSGYWKGRSFRYSVGSEPEVIDAIGHDLIRSGSAFEIGKAPVAITPIIPG